MAANTDTRLVNKMRNDSCTTALTVRTDKEMTDRVHADSPPNYETIISNRQTCRKIPGYIGMDTSNVIDDPRRGAKLSNSERKKPKPGSSQITEVTDNNMNYDSYVKRKVERNVVMTETRENKLDNAIKHTIEITDWKNEVDGANTPHNPRNHTDEIRKDEVEIDKAAS